MVVRLLLSHLPPPTKPPEWAVFSWGVGGGIFVLSLRDPNKMVLQNVYENDILYLKKGARLLYAKSTGRARWC